MSDLFPSRRYVVQPAGDTAGGLRFAEPQEAEECARALSAASPGSIINIDIYDAGEPVGSRHYRASRMVETRGDAR